MSHVLFISNNPRKHSHIEPAIKKGHTISLVKKKPDPKEYEIFDNVVDADLFDLQDVMKKVKELHSKLRIDGVLTRFEPYIPLVGTVCDMISLPGPRLRGCINCRDKLVMRKTLKDAGIGQPRFFDTKESIPKDAYPLLIKPTKGAKSRYIMRADDPEALSSAIRKIQHLVENSGHKLFRPIIGIDNKSNNIIAEEILRGKQVTTTSYIVNSNVHHIGIADIVTSQEIGMEGFHLISRTTPSTLSEKGKMVVIDISTKAIQALGINNSCLHPEIMITDDGPKVLEIAARIGGYRTEMTNYAFGINLNDIAIDVSLGIKPDIKKKHDKASTAVEVWPVKSGRLKGFRRMDDVLSINGLKEFKIKRVPGNMFRADYQGTQPVATFYTVANTPEKSRKIAEAVLNTLEPIIG